MPALHRLSGLLLMLREVSTGARALLRPHTADCSTTRPPRTAPRVRALAVGLTCIILYVAYIRYARHCISRSTISKNESLTLTQHFIGQKKNVVLPFTHFCTKHFGLFDKRGLSNPLLFWNFVQKQFKSSLKRTSSLISSVIHKRVCNVSVLYNKCCNSSQDL